VDTATGAVRRDGPREWPEGRLCCMLPLPTNADCLVGGRFRSLTGWEDRKTGRGGLDGGERRSRGPCPQDPGNGAGVLGASRLAAVVAQVVRTRHVDAPPALLAPYKTPRQGLWAETGGESPRCRGRRRSPGGQNGGARRRAGTCRDGKRGGIGSRWAEPPPALLPQIFAGHGRADHVVGLGMGATARETCRA